MVTANQISGSWDIFCKVVDNYGDAGVCWRLARMLHTEHGLRVQLWIDKPDALRALHPALDPALAEQQTAGITVRRWNEGAETEVQGVAVVIEAFGCGLPDDYVTAMAAQSGPPLWIVLEYLSAEDWVDTHHALSSPHPRFSLPRFFFFPGFTAGTGGLLREQDLLSRRDAFGDERKREFWKALGFDRPDALTLSLFCYADAPVAELLATLAEGDAPTVVAVPEGAPGPVVDRYFGPAMRNKKIRSRGALEVRALPFLPQSGYDELLWSCDLNLVRGEDSFVRAQWAAKPMVWQPYIQEGDAHHLKMQAFLQRYCAGLAPVPAAALAGFWKTWNDRGDVPGVWGALREKLPELGLQARNWASRQAEIPDLATQLVRFARGRVE